MPRENNPGFIRGAFAFRIPLVGVLDQAGAITYLASFVPGFILTIEKLVFVPDVAGAGAGATQDLVVRKGAAAGTALATVTVTLALHVLGGPGIASAAVVASLDDTARLSDADALSITKTAGTVFTAGGGTLLVFYRTRNQARR
jgi:hypothetical protein